MKRLFPSLPADATLGSVYQTFPDKLGPLSEFNNRVMRGDSELTVAERELIAAYVSGLNACTFCHGAHTIHAKAHGVPVETIEAMMEDVETSPIDPKMRPLLAYMKKTTLTPTRIVEADAEAVYAAGWSEKALFDALLVTGLFNLMNRILEGAGINTYFMDPNDAGEDMLEMLRSDTCYRDFGRMHGLKD